MVWAIDPDTKEIYKYNKPVSDWKEPVYGNVIDKKKAACEEADALAYQYLDRGGKITKCPPSKHVSTTWWDTDWRDLRHVDTVTAWARSHGYLPHDWPEITRGGGNPHRDTREWRDG